MPKTVADLCVAKGLDLEQLAEQAARLVEVTKRDLLATGPKGWAIAAMLCEHPRGGTLRLPCRGSLTRFRGGGDDSSVAAGRCA